MKILLNVYCPLPSPSLSHWLVRRTIEISPSPPAFRFSLSKIMLFAAVTTRHRLFSLLGKTLSIVRCSKSSSTRPTDSNHQLIKTFTHRGDYGKAFHLFDQLVKQNRISVVSLLTIVETCARATDLERGRQIERLINQSVEWKDNIRLQTSLINMYMKCQKIDQGNQTIAEWMSSATNSQLTFSRANLRAHSSFVCMWCSSVQCNAGKSIPVDLLRTQRRFLERLSSQSTSRSMFLLCWSNGPSCLSRQCYLHSSIEW